VLKVRVGAHAAIQTERATTAKYVIGLDGIRSWSAIVCQHRAVKPYPHPDASGKDTSG
jgi:hypothetical protein